MGTALQLSLAFLLALPLGWASERRSRFAGLLTYPLLSVCVCGFLTIAKGAEWEARQQADAFHGVITGMGFVGSGAMLKSRHEGVGVRAAVSLWVTGAIGAGMAAGITLLSVALSLATALTLWGSGSSVQGK